MWQDYAIIAILILVAFDVVFAITQSLQGKRQEMQTAELIALLDASNELTTEIASDLDALIEAVNNSGNVDPEVASKAEALKARLVEAAAKFTPGG